MEEISTNGETVAVPKALLEKLLDRVEELEEELQKYRDHNERDKAKIRQQVTEAVAESERSESDEEDEQGGDLLPMERLIQLGETGVTAEVTASVQRAKAIFQHFRQWASKTPSGFVVKDNLKQLLETATGESLAWKQVYRACRALERFTRGVIEFKKTRRHGWIVAADSLERMSSAGGR